MRCHTRPHNANNIIPNVWNIRFSERQVKRIVKKLLWKRQLSLPEQLMTKKGG